MARAPSEFAGFYVVFAVWQLRFAKSCRSKLFPTRWPLAGRSSQRQGPIASLAAEVSEFARLPRLRLIAAVGARYRFEVRALSCATGAAPGFILPSATDGFVAHNQAPSRAGPCRGVSAVRSCMPPAAAEPARTALARPEARLTALLLRIGRLDGLDRPPS
jgi:hypothetical protein